MSRVRVSVNTAVLNTLWENFPGINIHIFSLTCVGCLFKSTDWNLIHTHSDNEVPKVADFLGVSKSENQSDLAAFNEIQSSDSDYLFSNNSSLMPVMQQNSVVAATNSGSYEYQESANNNLQSLTLSMGSGKDSTCETSGDTSTNTTVEATAAAPRRTLETFGQRTSIYRGVTR